MTEEVKVENIGKWHLFPDACATPYYTTRVTFVNTNVQPIEVNIIYGDCTMLRGKNPLTVRPGTIKHDLRDMVNWNYFVRPKPGRGKQGECSLYIESVDGLFVTAAMEHINAWIGKGQKSTGPGQVMPLEKFMYEGKAPCGDEFGRIGGSEDSPFYGPGNVM